MATVKSLKEQNKLLAQQEERWVDIKRKADAQLKTLEKGTKEYIAQEKRIAKIEKKYKAVQDKLIDIGIQAEENFDIEDKIIELEKERLDLTKSIIRRVSELPKHQKAQLETTYGITTQMDLTTDLHRAALGYQREENSEGLKTSQHIQQQGKWLEEIATDQDKLNTLQLEMAEGWANIGTGDFTSKMEEIKKLEDEMAGKRAYYLTMVGSSSKYSEEAIKVMEAELDRNEELIATARDKATQQDRANALATAGAAAILGPLGKAKSALEALPFGDLISTSLQLDSVMKEFGDEVGKSLGEVASGALSGGDAFDKLKSIGGAAVDKISAGFSGLFKMLMANPMMIMVAAIVAAGMALKKLFGGFTELRKEMGLTFGAAADLQANITVTAAKFSLMGVSAEDVKGVVTGIQNEWGGVGSATEENIGLLTDLNARFGISGEHGAALSTQMMAVGAHSREAAAAQLASVGSLARASGVAPAAIMADIAENTEAFAGFAKDGGMNVMKAAISARKLGLNMGTVSKIADSLLDFESSIEAQMEASMLTGRAINTDKARELALSGDLVGMQKEITKQIGSQADWEAMNIVQRKALAKAFGMEVSEVGKMMAEQARRANMTQAEIAAEESALKEKAEKEERNQKMISDVLMFIGDLWASILKASKLLLPVITGIGIALAIAFWPITLAVGAVVLVIKVFQKLAEFIPGIQYALGAIVTLLALKYMWTQKIGFLNREALSNMWKQIKTGPKGIANLFKRLLGEKQITKEKQKQASAEGGLLSKGKKLAAQAKDKLKSMVGLSKGGDKGGGMVKKAKEKFTGGGKKGATGKKGAGLTGKKGGGKPLGGMFDKFDWKKALAGAAALLIIAAALWVTAKALQEFAAVSWGDMAKAGVALLGLVLVLGIIGAIMMSGVGAVAILAGAAAMLIIAASLLVLGIAIQAIAKGMTFLVELIPLLTKNLMAIVPVVPALFVFSIALGLMGIGFMAMAAGLLYMTPMLPTLFILTGLLLGIAVASKLMSSSIVSMTEPLTQLAAIAGPLLLLAGSFTALGASMAVMAFGAIAMIPALPVIMALSAMGLLGGVSLGGGGGEEAEAGGGAEANPVELKLESTNAKLDTLIGLMSEDGFMVENLKGIKKNTGTFADGII